MRLRDRECIQRPQRLEIEDVSQPQMGFVSRQNKSQGLLKPLSSPYNPKLAPAAFPTLQRPQAHKHVSSERRAAVPPLLSGCVATFDVIPQQLHVDFASATVVQEEKMSTQKASPEVEWSDLAPAMQVALYESMMNDTPTEHDLDMRLRLGLKQTQLDEVYRLHIAYLKREAEEEAETEQFLRAHLLADGQRCDDLLLKYHSAAFSDSSTSFNFSTIEEIEKAKQYLQQRRLPSRFDQGWAFVSPGKSAQPCDSNKRTILSERWPGRLFEKDGTAGDELAATPSLSLTKDDSTQISMIEKSHSATGRRRRGRPRKVSVELARTLRMQDRGDPVDADIAALDQGERSFIPPMVSHNKEESLGRVSTQANRPSGGELPMLANGQQSRSGSVDPVAKRRVKGQDQQRVGVLSSRFKAGEGNTLDVYQRNKIAAKAQNAQEPDTGQVGEQTIQFYAGERSAGSTESDRPHRSATARRMPQKHLALQGDVLRRQKPAMRSESASPSTHTSTSTGTYDLGHSLLLGPVASSYEVGLDYKPKRSRTVDENGRKSKSLDMKGLGKDSTPSRQQERVPDGQGSSTSILARGEVVRKRLARDNLEEVNPNSARRSLDNDRQIRQQPTITQRASAIRVTGSTARRPGGKAWRKGIRGAIQVASDMTKPTAKLKLQRR